MYPPRKFAKYKSLLFSALAGIFLLVAVFVIFPQVTGRSPANTAQSDIITLTAGIKNMHGNQSLNAEGGGYARLSNEQVLLARIPPKSMQKDGGIYSEWGPVHIFPANKEITLGPPYDLFVISYTNMPSSICVKLVPGLHQNFEAIFIGSQPNPLKTGARVALSPAEVVRHCSAAKTVHVDFVSK